MIDQETTVITREYKANSGVLIIENIFSPNKPKTDFIRELIENTALGSEYLLQSSCRNTAAYGSLAMEETN